jgi:hypothetical protein
MKLTKLISMLAVILMSAIIFTSCEETTGDPIDPNNPVPEAPGSIAAVSIDNSTVKLKWEASPSESNDLFDGYALIVTPGAAAPITIPAGTTEYTVTNLTEGDVYTFSLTAEYSNGESSSTVAIDWSPASRYTEVFGETIKLYGSSSSVGSGLDLYDDTEDGPMVRSVSSSNMWNFAFDDRNGAKFGTAGEGVIEYNWSAGAPQSGQLGGDEQNKIVYLVESLDEAYETQSLVDDMVYSYKAYDLEEFSDAAGVIFYARVADANGNYNYARILVKNTANGYVQSDALGNYIELEISYQNETNVPYAGIEQ